MEILIKASQFFLSLSILIILHEMGHFIPAKLFKTKVEKFYLFFDPWFSLLKKKIGGTEYGIGWLPLGGYVKIAGMVDESMDKEQMKQEPKPWEFRSKPAWQRLIIMLGGVTVNVILAIVIYTGMMMYYGEEYLAMEDAKYGVVTDSTAQNIGLQNGDKVLTVDGKPIERFMHINKEILLSEQGAIVVQRGNEKVEVLLDDTDKRDLIQAKSALVAPRRPYVAGGFAKDSPATTAGMLKGDSVYALNGKTMIFFDEYVDEIPAFAGNEITLSAMRDGKEVEFNVMVGEDGKIGVGAMPLDYFYKLSRNRYGFFDAIPAGIKMSYNVLGDYIRQFKLIVNPKTEAYKEVGGFLMIADQFDPVWNWQKFWGFTAFLSVMLAFLNILPIPALDGGHVVFVLIEMISGRKPSEKVLEYAQMVGFVILLGLIVLANGNDIIKLFN